MIYVDIYIRMYMTFRADGSHDLQLTVKNVDPDEPKKAGYATDTN